MRQNAEIKSKSYIKDALVRSQAIRLGISEGSRMLCTEIVPHGPIVLKTGNRK